MFELNNNTTRWLERELHGEDKVSNPVAPDSAFLQGFENFTKAGAAKNQDVLKSRNSFLLNISKKYVEQLYLMGLSLMVPRWLSSSQHWCV